MQVGPGPLRQEILSMVEKFAVESLKGADFVPGETPVPVSGKVLDPSDIAALVDASLDGWLTAGRFHEDFERALARYVGARSALFVIRHHTNKDRHHDVSRRMPCNCMRV